MQCGQVKGPDVSSQGSLSHSMTGTLASPRSFEAEADWVERSSRLMCQTQGTHIGRLPVEACVWAPQSIVACMR